MQIRHDRVSIARPKREHVNLKTTRLQEMIDWYGVVVGATVNLQSNNIAFISNDRTHHRIALLSVPGLRDDPEKIERTGIHHTAFEYGSFDDLMSSFARLKHSKGAAAISARAASKTAGGDLADFQGAERRAYGDPYVRSPAVAGQNIGQSAIGPPGWPEKAPFADSANR